MTRPPLTGEFPDSWLADDETLVKPPAARAGEAVWLNSDDLLDDEDTETTLRVAQYASVALGEVVSVPARPVSPPPPPVSPLLDSMPADISVTFEPPRRRRSLLLKATLLACGVAIMFEVGWLGGSRLTPPGASAQATAEWAPTRILLHKAPHMLAPSEPPPPAQSAKPEPKSFAFPMPQPAAVAPRVVPVASAAAAPSAAAVAPHAAAAATTEDDNAPDFVPGDL